MVTSVSFRSSFANRTAAIVESRPPEIEVRQSRCRALSVLSSRSPASFTVGVAQVINSWSLPYITPEREVQDERGAEPPEKTRLPLMRQRDSALLAAFAFMTAATSSKCHGRKSCESTPTSIDSAIDYPASCRASAHRAAMFPAHDAARRASRNGKERYLACHMNL